MKVKSIWVMALWVASLGAGSVILSCSEDKAKPPEVSAADKAAQKAAADKAAADKAAADRVAMDKAAAQKAAADKAAADKAAAAKAAAAKAAEDKAAADKAAAAKAAELAKAEAAALPPALVETKAEVTRVIAQIDLTMAKLDTLCAATGDLGEPSKNALAAMETLEAEAKALRTKSDEMRERGVAYFELWEKQLASMSTPEVADIAVKRKDELATQYAEVLTAMQETRAAMDAYWGDMTTIKKDIDDGLTADSQKLLAPKVKAAKEKVATLKTRVEETVTKVGQVGLIYKKP